MIRTIRKSRLTQAAQLALLTALMICGCMSAAERLHPDCQAQLPQINKFLVIAPEIGVFTEQGARLAFSASESQSASQRIQTAIFRNLTEKGFAVSLADARTMRQPEVQRVTALFRVVNRSIQLHTYGPQIIPSKQTLFDYGVGSVDELLKADAADALILCTGQQTESQSDPKTWLSVAVVAPNGLILWYALDGAKESLELENSIQAHALVEKTLASLTRIPTEKQILSKAHHEILSH